MAGNFDFLKSQLFGTIPVPAEDLTRRTILLTGANSGLGLDCAKHLVRLNISRLIIACRTEAKCEAAKQEILSGALSASELKTDIQAWTLEMTSYASVLAFAERCKSIDRLDGVILNAGILMKEYNHAEDNEATITINVISTTLLALLLLPKLQESASHWSITPHLSIVGSAVHYWAKADVLLRAADGKMLNSLDDPKTFHSRAQRYNLSKLMVMFIVRELAKKISSETKEGTPFVIVNCVAPGWCKTPFFRQDEGGAVERSALRILGRSCEEGSRTLVHAVTAGKETHGQYVSECRVKPASPFVRSKEGVALQERVWKEMMDEMEKIKPEVGAKFK